MNSSIYQQLGPDKLAVAVSTVSDRCCCVFLSTQLGIAVLKSTYKRKTLKAVRGGKTCYLEGTKNLASQLFSRLQKSEDSGKTFLKCERRCCQPIILYSVNISFKKQSEIKIILGEQKLREVISSISPPREVHQDKEKNFRWKHDGMKSTRQAKYGRQDY